MRACNLQGRNRVLFQDAQWSPQSCWCSRYIGPQYGSLEKAWMAIMTEADKVSELHQEVKNSLLNDDFEKVKNWQKDAFHKQIMGGFKEAKEAEDGFRKAQKPWAKKMKEVGRAGGGEKGRVTHEVNLFMEERNPTASLGCDWESIPIPF